MKIETHVHTKYSKDSLLCFWPLYLKLRVLKINVIAITDHNNIAGGVRFKDFCIKRRSNIQVIVGEEIFTLQGEVIGLYLKKAIEPGLSAKETICQIKEQGGIVYIPHPYDERRYKTVLDEDAIAENRDFIDCIEIHNGRNESKNFDREQKRIADKYNLVPIIGSDAHTWIEIGRNYMECENADFAIPDEFRKALDYLKFYEKKCLKSAHYLTKISKTVKLVGEGNFDEIFRIVIKKFKRS